MSLILIHPYPDRPEADARLSGILSHALAGREGRTLRRAEELEGLEGRKLLCARPLGEDGVNLEYVRMLARLRREPGLLAGCTAGLTRASHSAGCSSSCRTVSARASGSPPASRNARA